MLWNVDDNDDDDDVDVSCLDNDASCVKKETVNSEIKRSIFFFPLSFFSVLMFFLNLHVLLKSGRKSFPFSLILSVSCTWPVFFVVVFFMQFIIRLLLLCLCLSCCSLCSIFLFRDLLSLLKYDLIASHWEMIWYSVMPWENIVSCRHNKLYLTNRHLSAKRFCNSQSCPLMTNAISQSAIMFDVHLF